MWHRPWNEQNPEEQRQLKALVASLKGVTVTFEKLCEILKGEVTIRPTGTCFTDALEFIEKAAAENPEVFATKRADRIRLVHGICLMPDGRPYSHAWVEELGQVWFSGTIEGVGKVYAETTREAFHHEFQVQEFTAYTMEETLRLNYESGHYGPWEQKYRVLCRDYPSDS